MRLLEIERKKLEEEAEKQRKIDEFQAKVELDLQTRLDAEHAKVVEAKEQEKRFIEGKLR